MTLKLVMGLGPSSTSRLAQVVLVPLAQTGWLYQTCSIGSRRGQNKPLLVSWHKSYTSIGPFLVPWHKLYTTMELVPDPLVPTCDKKWVHKEAKLSMKYVVNWIPLRIRVCSRNFQNCKNLSEKAIGLHDWANRSIKTRSGGCCGSDASTDISSLRSYKSFASSSRLSCCVFSCFESIKIDLISFLWSTTSLQSFCFHSWLLAHCVCLNLSDSSSLVRLRLCISCCCNCPRSVSNSCSDSGVSGL